MKKSKQELKARRQLRETGQNIEVIFKAGQKIFPLMDERECCEAILKMSKWKAPRTQAEFFILFKANHEKNLKWARENLEIASLAEDGEISTCVTSNPVALVDTQGNLISSQCVEDVTKSNIEEDGNTLSPNIPASKESLSEKVGN